MYNLEDTIEKGDVLCPGYNILRLEEKDFSELVQKFSKYYKSRDDMRLEIDGVKRAIFRNMPYVMLSVDYEDKKGKIHEDKFSFGPFSCERDFEINVDLTRELRRYLGNKFGEAYVKALEQHETDVDNALSND